MTAYVLRRHEDGKYVANPGHKTSYVRSLQAARVFSSHEEAETNKCDNESIVPITGINLEKNR